MNSAEVLTRGVAVAILIYFALPSGGGEPTCKHSTASYGNCCAQHGGPRICGAEQFYFAASGRLQCADQSESTYCGEEPAQAATSPIPETLEITSN